MTRFAVCDQNFATRDCAGNEKRAGFDPVRDNRVGRAVKFLDALYADRRSSRTFDSSAHFYEKCGQVGDFRFERAIFQHRFAFGERSSCKYIFGSGDGDFRKAERHTAKTFRARFDVTVLDADIRAEFFERLNMKIYRTRANGASSGQGNARVTEPGE